MRSLLSGAGFSVEQFHESGMIQRQAWTLRSADHALSRAHGGVFLGLPRHRLADEQNRLVHLSSESQQVEAAIANVHRVPMLLMRTRSVLARGAFAFGDEHVVVEIPDDADAGFISSPAFREPYELWAREVRHRKDVFLGYCSAASKTARRLRGALLEMGVSVEDWATDFTAGGTILESVAEAARRCTCAVFLFTRDDPLKSKGSHASPRDNVIFEAGYFMATKGKERTLIIREEGAKMPVDLGGIIYVPLAHRKDIGAINTALERFVDKNV